MQSNDVRPRPRGAFLFLWTPPEENAGRKNAPVAQFTAAAAGPGQSVVIADREDLAAVQPLKPDPETQRKGNTSCPISPGSPLWFRPQQRFQSVTSTVGNGVGNTIGGNVITEGDQRVGDHGFSSFGPGGDNAAHQDVSATVANGAFNTVGGNVVTEGHQSVGDHGFSSFSLGGDNTAHQDVHATVGNGLGNFIGGNVITEGSQSVGNHGFGSFGLGGDNMAASTSTRPWPTAPSTPYWAASSPWDTRASATTAWPCITFEPEGERTTAGPARGGAVSYRVKRPSRQPGRAAPPRETTTTGSEGENHDRCVAKCIRRRTDIGVDAPTAVVGNGLGNSVGGSVLAIGDQHVGDSGHYNGFGPVNVAVDVPTLVAGNGVGNSIGGDAIAFGGQDVGGQDHSFHAATPFGGVNVAVETPTVIAGNGAFNAIGGNVEAIGLQHVADPGFHHG